MPRTGLCVQKICQGRFPPPMSYSSSVEAAQKESC